MPRNGFFLIPQRGYSRTADRRAEICGQQCLWRTTLDMFPQTIIQPAQSVNISLFLCDFQLDWRKILDMRYNRLCIWLPCNQQLISNTGNANVTQYIWCLLYITPHLILIFCFAPRRHGFGWGKWFPARTTTRGSESQEETFAWCLRYLSQAKECVFVNHFVRQWTNLI